MGSRRFLFVFGIGGGFLAGATIGLVMHGITGQPSTLGSWAAVLLTGIATFLVGGYLPWFKWAAGRQRRRSRVITALSQGDLTFGTSASFEGKDDFRRLVLSLRRALSQVQRVTGNVHRTCKD